MARAVSITIDNPWLDLLIINLFGQKRLKREMDLEVFGESPLISKRKANRSKFKNKSQNNE